MSSLFDLTGKIIQFHKERLENQKPKNPTTCWRQFMIQFMMESYKKSTEIYGFREESVEEELSELRRVVPRNTLLPAGKD